MHETFVFYLNPKSEIETITRKIENSDENFFSISYFVYDENNGKLILISHL